MPRITLPGAGRPHAVIEPAGEAGLHTLDYQAIAALYREHGALLLRGFDAEAGAFRGFAQRFCSTAVVNESPGRSPIDAPGRVYTVDAGGKAFALHPELSREPWKPDAAFFGCLTPPDGDGATTICDGIELVRALPAALREALLPRRLCYIAPAWPALLEYWLGSAAPGEALLRQPPAGCPYKFARDAQGRIVRYFTRPMLHKPMFAEVPAFGNFLLFARFNNQRRDFPLLDDLTPVPELWLQALKAAGEATTAAIEWRRGDVLMLDNTRFMHGRTAIRDPTKRLIATYFGYLRFAVPDPEEPLDPVWRREDFLPPLPPNHPKPTPLSRP